MTEEEPKIFTEGESLLGDDEQQELNEFRKRQLAGEELETEDRRRFLELQRKAEQAKQDRV